MLKLLPLLSCSARPRVVAKPRPTVTIMQTAIENEFRGFIIQARRKSGDMDAPIGTFKDPPANTQLLGCTPAGSTWAHSAATDKVSVAATWTAPSSDEGTLAFRATIVVQNSGGTSLFYENIMSEDLTYNGPTEAPAMLTTASELTEAPEMMTTARDDKDDNGAGIIQASLLLTVVTLLIISLLSRRL